MISDADVARYHEDGYIVVPDVLTPAQLDALRSECDEVVAGASKVTENDACYDLEATHTPERPRVRRIKDPLAVMPSSWEIGKDPRVLSILERLIGPDIRLQKAKLNMKSAEYGAPVEWHQDWAFYPHTNDDLLAMGVMMDDCHLENGPLLMVPGSHRGPVFDHHADGYFCGAIDPSTCGVDFGEKAVPLTGPAGSLTFHHVRMVHGSAQNTSARERRLLLYQYQAADAWPLMERYPNLEAYASMVVAGAPTTAPRLADVPVRMPVPVAVHDGSIYENQRTLGARYFETTGTAQSEAAE
ncbi:MAG: phytanoyl-CoA dioxygenase [Gammaproteobacteria bacterium]|nr:phytanoyl-CoA dioxygenase [Gammaproteobacteria bacterium]